MKLPILVEQCALRPDSGGAGRFRGGLGVDRSVRALVPMNVNTKIERTMCAPWGLQGGHDGAANRDSIVRAGGEHVRFRNGKVEDRLETGDSIVIETGGGGGFGDPRERARCRPQRCPARLHLR